jgi:hypothetical protein
VILPTLRESRSTLVLWVATLTVEGAMLWFVRSRPLWLDLLRPFMILVLVPAVIATWRLLRPRSGRDRREAERRAAARRTDDGRAHADGHPPTSGVESGS